ncbi:MAG: hypothetical protein R2699_03580 [Acidimicrobiales bacterium]
MTSAATLPRRRPAALTAPKRTGSPTWGSWRRSRRPHATDADTVFRDITVGNNDVWGRVGCCAAGPGYDLASGLGLPGSGWFGRWRPGAADHHLDHDVDRARGARVTPQFTG